MNNAAPETINQDRRQQMMPVGKIHMRPQVRSHIDADELAALQQSIHEKGILQPITVTPIGADSYMIIAGHRRFTAAMNIGLKQVPVFVRQGNVEDMRSLQATENLVRCNLNALERTESLILLFCAQFNMTQDQACVYLRRLRRAQHNPQFSSEVQAVNTFFRSYNVNWVSYVAADLRNLSLTNDLKDACRDHGLDVSKARELSRITDATLRRQITTSVLQRKMSLKETRDEVSFHLPPRRTRSNYTMNMGEEFYEQLNKLPESRQKIAMRLISQLNRTMSQPVPAGARRGLETSAGHLPAPAAQQHSYHS